MRAVQHQKPKTIERKALIVRRIKEDWPTGRLTQISKIKPSDVELWLSRYSFGPVSRNLHVACAKEIFEMAVRDNVISRSPAAHLRSSKLDRPIRTTPTFDEFKAIVREIRNQLLASLLEQAPHFVTEAIGVAAPERNRSIDVDDGDRAERPFS